MIVICLMRGVDSNELRLLVADFRSWKRHLDLDVGTLRYQPSRLPKLMG